MWAATPGTTPSPVVPLMPCPPPLLLGLPDLDGLIGLLRDRGHRTIGPTIREAAVVYAEIRVAADLPTGWLDEQDGGHYRLHAAAAAGPFDHVVGPHSLKAFLFPPRETIERWRREDGVWSTLAATLPTESLAVLGPRACDLAALAIQDRIFLQDEQADPWYRCRRERLFIVAVNCRRAAPTCFCHSLGTGPAVTGGCDLLLTPLPDDPTSFLLETSSDRGVELAVELRRGRGLQAAALEPGAAARVTTTAQTHTQQNRSTAGNPGFRSLDTEGIRDLLFSNLEHPRWTDVAERCLACGNCTAVCPTCFCSGIDDVADLNGSTVERQRHWISCFSLEHSQLHGANARPEIRSRYRQWLTHKLAGWIDQFGTSGCVGCGRCITWCPVGIDLTAEVAAIRESASTSERETP